MPRSPWPPPRRPGGRGGGNPSAGILAGPLEQGERRPPRPPVVAAAHGTPIEHLPSRTRGTVERFANSRLLIRTADGEVESFPLVAGQFSIDGVRCLPVFGRTGPAVAPPVRTPSGSRAWAHRPRVARASRILVEGTHDAELLEKVWGDDLRHEGIVVEAMGGMDGLADLVAAFGPGPGRRLGVLLDHLVPGSKEDRAAAGVTGAHVLVTGTPFVDVWQAVRPAAAGIDHWPDVPPGEDWKTGVLVRLGRGGTHPGAFWKELLGRVETYADLFPPFVGAVEQLIDFVTVEP